MPHPAGESEKIGDATENVSGRLYYYNIDLQSTYVPYLDQIKVWLLLCTEHRERRMCSDHSCAPYSQSYVLTLKL